MDRDEFDDRPPVSEANCPYHCHHGWVEVYQDEDGNYLGAERWDPSYAHVPVEVPAPTDDDPEATTLVHADYVAKDAVYPCPTHEPDLFLRWQEGKLGSDRPGHRRRA